MFSLPLDVRIEIASYFDSAWVQLAIYDIELYNYTVANKRQFVNLFTVKDENQYYTTYKLLGRLHRLDDLPAVCSGDDLFWYQNDKLYRENGQYTAYEDYDMKWYISKEPHYRYRYHCHDYIWDHASRL